MRIKYQVLFIYLFLAGFIFIFACSNVTPVNVAGNGSGTGAGNPVVWGTVYDPATKKGAKHISVKIRKNDFVKDTAHNEYIDAKFNSFTSDSGLFRFDSLDPGNYSIEFSGDSTHSLLVRFSIHLKEDTSVQISDTLRVSSKINGVVTAVSGLKGDAVVYVYGMDRMAIPNDSGKFAFTLPPNVKYTLLIVPNNHSLARQEHEIEELVEGADDDLGKFDYDDFLGIDKD